MKKFLLLLSVVLFVSVFSDLAQDAPKRNMSPPPTSMDPDNSRPPADSATLLRHINLVQLQKDADDLARTAQSIPLDVANVRRGVLPKDTLQKLKQIEKLSKHLRSELNP